MNPLTIGLVVGAGITLGWFGAPLLARFVQWLERR